MIQQVGLFPHMTIGDNIATVPRLLGWPKARTRERTAELLDARRARAGRRDALPGAALGRPAPARRPRARARGRSAGAPDGRAVRRARPDHARRLQEELRRLHREVAKTVIFVTHDIDEAITMGDRIAILREGGVLAQYDTPDAILAHPADDFVAQFIGEDRALRRLALRRLGEVELDPRRRTGTGRASRRRPPRRVRNAVSLMLGSGDRPRCSWSATTASRSACSASPHVAELLR